MKYPGLWPPGSSLSTHRQREAGVRTIADDRRVELHDGAGALRELAAAAHLPRVGLHVESEPLAGPERDSDSGSDRTNRLTMNAR